MTDTIITFPRHGIPGYYALADLPQQPPIGDRCFGTGWSELDQLIKFYAGQFVLVTGKPGHGKSTFLFNLICNVARLQGIRSYLYVPENEAVVFHKLKTIWNDEATFSYFAGSCCFVQSGQIEHYEGEPRTLHWVLDKAANVIERDGVEFVVIDPWNELERAKPKDQALTDYINDCLQLVKQFTRHFAVTVLMVAHPTKAAADPAHVPTLADVEGSMNWWNKSDNGMVIFRDYETKVTRVISAKVREQPDAGQPGTRNFWVDEQTGIFTPMVGAASGYQPSPRKY
jgi:twinkle protein